MIHVINSSTTLTCGSAFGALIAFVLSCQMIIMTSFIQIIFKHKWWMYTLVINVHHLSCKNKLVLLFLLNFLFGVRFPFIINTIECSFCSLFESRAPS